MVTLALVGLTAGAKLALAPPPTPAPSPNERIGDYLRRAGAQGLAPAPRSAQAWSGWSFRWAGCPARAYPQQLGGDRDASLRQLVQPTEAAIFVFGGAASADPPGPAGYFRYFADRALQSVGLGGGGDAFYVAVIYPPACPAARGLSWRGL
jgi:hypothetical protein